jgi:Ca2+-binding RTX toxin-like protein
MAYTATGSSGNDTLDQSANTGPGTIIGLAGDDTITLGTGLATVTGDSGNDSVLLQAGNTGTVNGGIENDSISGPAGSGPMLLFGSDGSDTVNVPASSAAFTVLGGNDSNDGPDLIITGGGNDLVFGNGGDDQLFSGTLDDTAIGGFGNDLISKNSNTGADLVFGNEGNDTVWMSAGNDTVFAGQGNDSVRHHSGVTGGNPLLFGNEGGDTVDASTATNATVVGGNDAADGADSIVDLQAGANTLWAFGNGGADTVDSNTASATVIGGFGSDSLHIRTGVGGAGLIFCNEGDDTVDFGTTAGPSTTFGGLGNDTVWTDDGTDCIQGNEGNDTLRGDDGIDTIAGGSGGDVFYYSGAANDGDNAAAGGPVELLTDVNFDEDRFRTSLALEFAANIGAGSGANLQAAATNAIGAANALGGGGATTDVAVLFTFGGHTYLAINQDATRNAFDDAGDLLLDVTGATGTIDLGDFNA